MRTKFGSLVEWVLATACIFALLAMSSSVVREFRVVSAVTPVIAHEAAVADPPQAVPPRSVSVPMVLLSDGSAVHVGDAADQVMTRVGRDAETAAPSIDRTASGDRTTRFYERAGTRFVVVFQRMAADGQIRVSAIYLP